MEPSPLHAANGVEAQADGKPIAAPVELVSDEKGKPTEIRTGTQTFYLIKREERVGIRLKDSESEARRMAIEGSGVGVFGPLLGPVYYLAHAGRLHRDGGLVTAARELLVPFVGAGIEADDSFDLVSGSAGCILALLALHEVASDSDALELAGRAAERLLATAVPAAPAGAGCGWRVSGLGDQPLAGLAHGSSGITLALARLQATRPEARLLPAITGGLRHEAGLFDRRARNWPRRLCMICYRR